MVGTPTGNKLAPGTPAGLPMVVTDHFQNRGWFGDAAIAGVLRHQQPRDQRERHPVAEPCAMRAPGARGQCLRVQLHAARRAACCRRRAGTSAYFLLTTVHSYHPEVAPTPRPGEANWGYEPTVALPPGATEVSFWAAADAARRTVTFRGLGADQDTFAVPDADRDAHPDLEAVPHLPRGGSVRRQRVRSVRLGARGHQQGGDLLRGRHRVERDSGPPGRAAAHAPPIPPFPPAAGAGPRARARPARRPAQREPPDGGRQPVHAAALGSDRSACPRRKGGGFRLDARHSGRSRSPPPGCPDGSGRAPAAASTPSASAPARRGTCRPCDGCSSVEKCGTRAGETPVTLAEFTFRPGAADIYDLSLVDGYNLPMVIAPLPGTFTGQRRPFNCKSHLLRRRL